MDEKILFENWYQNSYISPQTMDYKPCSSDPLEKCLKSKNRQAHICAKGLLLQVKDNSFIE